MQEIEIRLNDFLFNSGILGFYKVLKNAGKDKLIKEKGNTIYVSDIPDEDWDIVKKALQFKVFAKLSK